MSENNNILLAINQVEYSNGPEGPIVHIFGRDSAGEASQVQVTGFQPYFYAPLEQADTREPPEQVVLVDKEQVYPSIRGEDLRRLYTRRPSDVRDVRDGYRHYEADIPFATRFMIDMGLTGGVSVPSLMPDYREAVPAEVQAPARICFMDIECEDERGFPEPERDSINCITCWDSFDDVYTTFYWPAPGTQHDSDALRPAADNHEIQTCESEISLLRNLASYVQDKDPDILSGWNYVEFDIPYITRRMEVLGLKPDSLSRIPGMGGRNALRGRALFDLLMAYKKMHTSRKESYRLDAIAEEELGEGKVRYTGTISDLWRNDPQTFIDYNYKDVELCVGINRKSNIIDFYREIARYVGCPLDRTLNSSQVIDIFVLRKAHGKYVLPSKGFAAGDEFEGATVFDPSLGLKENVVVLDLKSLYPMCMMTINASPETKDSQGELRAPNGIRFKREPDGLTRGIISDLLVERDEKKALRNEYPYDSPEYVLYDLQQNVLKVIMNTYYGVSGYARFRLYDREIGSAVTSVGRAIIAHTRSVITDMGYSVLYGDTDSCMIHLPPVELDETIEIARKIEKRLNDSYSEFAKEVLNADHHYFSIKFEKVYRRFFQSGKKKRYAGQLVWKEGKTVDQLDIVGFEMRRSDSPHITKEVQQHVMEMILKGADFPVLKKYLGDVIRKYRRGGYSLDDVGIPGGIGKALESYENKDVHVRGAIYSNENLNTDFKRGSKPKRIYIKSVKSKYPRTDVLCFEYADQVPSEFVIDWEKMMEKSIQQPISRIIEAIGYKWADVDPSRTTLFDFGM